MRYLIVLLTLCIVACGQGSAVHIEFFATDPELNEAAKLAVAEWNDACGYDLEVTREEGYMITAVADLPPDIAGMSGRYVRIDQRIIHESEILTQVIAHEMGHQLGFGHSQSGIMAARGISYKEARIHVQPSDCLR